MVALAQSNSSKSGCISGGAICCGKSCAAKGKSYELWWCLSLIFQFPIYLEPSSQLPIYQVTIDPWFQIYRVVLRNNTNLLIKWSRSGRVFVSKKFPNQTMSPFIPYPWSGVIILPTQTMHYYKGNSPKLPVTFALFDSPKNGSHSMIPAMVHNLISSIQMTVFRPQRSSQLCQRKLSPHLSTSIVRFFGTPKNPRCLHPGKSTNRYANIMGFETKMLQLRVGIVVSFWQARSSLHRPLRFIVFVGVLEFKNSQIPRAVEKHDSNWLSPKRGITKNLKPPASH